MGGGNKFAIKVVLVLAAYVHLEIVAGDHVVGIKQDAHGVVATIGCQLS